MLSWCYKTLCELPERPQFLQIYTFYNHIARQRKITDLYATHINMYVYF